MMKLMYKAAKICTFRHGSSRLALFMNMAVWFAAGSVLGFMFGKITGAEPVQVKAYATAVGACLSLLGGYVGGMLWLVNRNEK